MATWTKEQERDLKTMYQVASQGDLEKHFGRNMTTISAKARNLGLKRKRGALSKPGAKPGKWGREVRQLQTMIDDRANAKELSDTLNRPFDEILAEAKKLDMDCDYLMGGGSSTSLALPFEKEIKSRLGLVLDLDVRVNIRSFKVEMGDNNA